MAVMVGNGGGAMAAIVIRQNAKAAGLAGRAGGRAAARGMVRRAMDYAAATVLAAVLLNSLRRSLCGPRRWRAGVVPPTR